MKVSDRRLHGKDRGRIKNVCGKDRGEIKIGHDTNPARQILRRLRGNTSYAAIKKNGEKLFSGTK
jgi:hypothetical protein